MNNFFETLKIMKRVYLILLISSLVFFIFWLWITWDWLKNDSINNSNTKIGIIYWNKVELTWEPSSRLKARLDTWFELYNSWIIQKIIVSWWLGKEGFDEASVMKEYLVSQWIESKHIIEDNLGNNTQLTSKNAKNIINELSFGDFEVVAISQFYHISRVKLSLKKNWFEEVYWYAPKYFELRDFYSLFREIFAYLKYIFLFYS